MAAVIRGDVKILAKSVVECGIYKYQPETVKDAVRQIAFRYAIKAGTLKEMREITWKASKKSEERLSQAVRNMREEAI